MVSAPIFKNIIFFSAILKEILKLGQDYPRSTRLIINAVRPLHKPIIVVILGALWKTFVECQNK